MTFAEELRATAQRVQERKIRKAKLLKNIKTKLMAAANEGKVVYETEYLGCHPEEEYTLVDEIRKEGVVVSSRLCKRDKGPSFGACDDDDDDYQEEVKIWYFQWGHVKSHVPLHKGDDNVEQS